MCAKCEGSFATETCLVVGLLLLKEMEITGNDITIKEPACENAKLSNMRNTAYKNDKCCANV